MAPLSPVDELTQWTSWPVDQLVVDETSPHLRNLQLSPLNSFQACTTTVTTVVAPTPPVRRKSLKIPKLPGLDAINLFSFVPDAAEK